MGSLGPFGNERHASVRTGKYIQNQTGFFIGNAVKHKGWFVGDARGHDDVLFDALLTQDDTIIRPTTFDFDPSL